MTKSVISNVMVINTAFLHRIIDPPCFDSNDATMMFLMNTCKKQPRVSAQLFIKQL